MSPDAESTIKATWWSAVDNYIRRVIHKECFSANINVLGLETDAAVVLNMIKWMSEEKSPWAIGC